MPAGRPGTEGRNKTKLGDDTASEPETFLTVKAEEHEAWAASERDK